MAAAPDDYIGTLERFEAAGDREGILRYFNNIVVGMPEEMVEGMRGTPMWEPMLALTYTVKYDGLCLGGDDQSLPDRDAAPGRRCPSSSVCSSGTPMPCAARLGRACSPTRCRTAEPSSSPGDFHQVPAPVLAPVLAEFYRA